MPKNPTTKPENIFVVKSNELKVIMRKYHEAFPNAFPSYFDSSIATKNKVDLTEIKKKLNNYFDLTKIDFKLEDYNAYDGEKKIPEFHLPYELADVYCIMAYMICNNKNLLSDGKRTVTSDTAPEDIFNFHIYNNEVLKGIDILPAQISDFIRRQPAYDDHSTLTKYLYEITDRFVVLLSAVAHSEDSMGLLINKLDDFINDFMPNTYKSASARLPSAPIYFDRLLTDVFKDIGQHSSLKKSTGYIPKKEINEIYERCFVDAWSKYNTELERLRAKYNEAYSEMQLNETIYGTMVASAKILEDLWHYNPTDFLDHLLFELEQKGVISKCEYKAAYFDHILEMPLRMNIEGLLNSAYNNIDKYRDLYIDERVLQCDKDDIAEYRKIFDELNPKSDTPTKMKEKENYKYKKFFREIYLASLGLADGIKETFTEEHLLKVKWLLPYCYKFQVSHKENPRESIIKELKNEFKNRTIRNEYLEFAEDTARNNLFAYKGLAKYLLFLFVLFDFMTRIRKGEPNSGLFLPMIKSSVEEKICAIGLSEDERMGLCNYREMDDFYFKLDWKNILSDENYLLFHELKEDTLRSEPFKAYYSELKEGANRIIENITKFDGDDFANYLSSLSEDIELEATVFLEEIYIEGELEKSRKYYEHKDRSQFVVDNVRSIMGGLFRDIAMKEMNLKE